MMFKEKLKEAVRHPVTFATGAASAFGIVLHPEVVLAVLMALWQSAPTLFTISSIGAFTLPRILPGLDFLKPVFLAVLGVSGVLYLARLGLQTWNNFDKKL